MRSFIFLCMIAFIFILSACSGTQTDPLDDTTTDTEVEEPLTEDSDNYDTYSTDENSKSPYTKEELESDPRAPSTDPNDYNENGEYVPQDGPSDNPADYNSDGEYKPVEEMTQDEIEQELEEILGDSLGQ